MLRIESEHSGLKEFFRQNGVCLTAGIIVADVVGAGILAMPLAVANFGLVPGSIALVVFLAANVHISIVMWRVRMFCPTCENANTYTALVRGAFASAPVWQRHLMVVVTGFCQKSFILGMLVLYLMSAGKGFGMMFYETQICLPVWVFYAALLLFPFAVTARRMGTWQSLVWINVATIIGTVLIPLAYYALYGTEKFRLSGSKVEMVSNLSSREMLSSASIYTFGMTSQFLLVEIIAEMKEPLKMPIAYAAVSAPLQLVMFAVAGIGGYLCMGNKVDGMMNENLPFGGAFQLAAGCMLTHMLISYLIKGVVLCKSVHRLADAKYADASDNRLRSWIVWICIVSLMLLLAWFLANIVPFFGAAVDLLGASVTPISCWLVPLILYMRMCCDYPDWDCEDPKSSSRCSRFLKSLEWVAIGQASDKLLPDSLPKGIFACDVRTLEDMQLLRKPCGAWLLPLAPASLSSLWATEYQRLASQASNGEGGLLPIGSNGFYKACLMALLCVVGAALAAGLTMGLVSIDPMEMEIIVKTEDKDMVEASAKQKLKKDQAAAERILPLIHDHHLLLVTLLLMNSIANEALPLFLDQIVPSWLAVVLSVSLVLMFGEIIPSAVFTGSEQLTMAARFSGLVGAFMFVLTPVSWPIAKLLDRVLGADHKGRYNFAELRAIVSMHAGLRLGGEEDDQASIAAFSYFLLKHLKLTDVTVLCAACPPALMPGGFQIP
ncbi:unnamed protein product [Cladocopium goreaui]|uniref:CNNM transmembrane domain-containing protein n=1 Tax=Cladocopium goreaui TaxID=2562237 RepID=A0A9P1GJN9_9DINO|nr:unnamed protein product [Cladocopium goreaui]